MLSPVGSLDDEVGELRRDSRGWRVPLHLVEQRLVTVLLREHDAAQSPHGDLHKLMLEADETRRYCRIDDLGQTAILVAGAAADVVGADVVLASCRCAP